MAEISKSRVEGPSPRTKRAVCSLVMSIFDPLGHFAPFSLYGRVLLQKLTKLKLGWDEPIPEDILGEIVDWRSSILQKAQMSVPRWIGSSSLNEDAECRFHVLADASKLAYACVVYAHFDDGDNQHSSIVISRSRVIPSNSSTSGLHGSIPWAELCGAELATGVALSVAEAYGEDIGHFVFWSDSLTNLRWVYNGSLKLDILVENRVSKILALTNPRQWNYEPSAENPADLPSRGIKADNKESWRKFHEGPGFLRQPRSEWPQMPCDMAKIENDEFGALLESFGVCWRGR